MNKCLYFYFLSPISTGFKLLNCLICTRQLGLMTSYLAFSAEARVSFLAVAVIPVTPRYLGFCSQTTGK